MISKTAALRFSLPFINKRQPRQRLVLIGTGWSSYAVLKYVDKKIYDVTVISPRNYFLFTPLLASTTVGTLNFTSIIDNIRQGHKFRTTSDYQCSNVLAVDTKNNILKCQSALDTSGQTYDVEYDKLVVGCGAVTNTFNIPGVYEYAFFLKDIPHAMSIKRKLLENLEMVAGENISAEERRQRLHVIIVGGGPTGIEFGAEVYDFMKSDIKKRFPDIADHVKVSIIDAGKILSMFDEKLRKTAETKIRQRPNFSLFEDTGVVEVQEDRVILSDGTVMRSNLVVWSTGLKPNPLLENIQDIELTNRGYIKTDNFMQSSIDNIWAVGDCGQVTNKDYLQTAQQAEQQGKYLAKKIFNDPGNPEPEEYQYVYRGIMAYIGNYSALMETPKSKQGLQATWEGVHGWLAWRSAYWTMLGRWYMRVQVPFDWIKTFIWGRDTSIFINTKRPDSIKNKTK